MATYVFIPKWILLLSTVLLSSLVILAKTNNKIICNSIFVYLGKRSFSIFIWHQIILAFYRYTVSADIFSIKFLLPYFVVTLLLSEISYRIIEQGLKPTTKNTIIAISFDIIITCCGLYIFNHAGVVRDVPELDVVKGQEHRGMFGEYCDRIYAYDKDFSDNGKINVLVEGISFGRDFANVLLESDIADKINLSYIFEWKDIDSLKQINRIKESDFIFSFKAKSEVPKFVWDNLKPTTQVYGIGTKNYGESNGIIYSHRNSYNYYTQAIELDHAYASLNAEWKSEWGKDNYIDFIELAMVDKTHIRVFTPDNRYISQDCRHLSPAGAQWYAKVLDLHKILNIQ